MPNHDAVTRCRISAPLPRRERCTSPCWCVFGTASRNVAFYSRDSFEPSRLFLNTQARIYRRHCRRARNADNGRFSQRIRPVAKLKCVRLPHTVSRLCAMDTAAASSRQCPCRSLVSGANRALDCCKNAHFVEQIIVCMTIWYNACCMRYLYTL